MRLPWANPVQAAPVPVAPRVGPLARASASSTQLIAGAAIVPMVAVTVWLALASDHLKWPLASALYYGYLTAATLGVGLYWWIRRPASGFGRLLVCLGFLTWMVSWEGSDKPLLFSLGV